MYRTIDVCTSVQRSFSISEFNIQQRQTPAVSCWRWWECTLRNIHNFVDCCWRGDFWRAVEHIYSPVPHILVPFLILFPLSSIHTVGFALWINYSLPLMVNTLTECTCWSWATSCRSYGPARRPDGTRGQRYLFLRRDFSYRNVAFHEELLISRNSCHIDVGSTCLPVRDWERRHPHKPDVTGGISSGFTPSIVGGKQSWWCVRHVARIEISACCCSGVLQGQYRTGQRRSWEDIIKLDLRILWTPQYSFTEGKEFLDRMRYRQFLS
jgi:hypothetical protein